MMGTVKLSLYVMIVRYLSLNELFNCKDVVADFYVITGYH